MHDLVTIGEVMLRLAIPSPARIESVSQLDVQIGGAEANVAAACARLGLRSAWISALPANAWGDRTRRELTAHGVDCAHVRTVDGARMGLYFIEYGAAPRPVRVLYDRRDSAFARLRAEDVDWEPVRRARLVHLTGITPALGPGPRSVVERALDEASQLSFDVNYRATLWSPAEARAFAESVLPRARYFFLGEAEARTLFELTGSSEATLQALARLAPKATIARLRPRRARQCSMADASGGPAGAIRCRWSIRLAPVMPTSPGSCGRRSTGGARRRRSMLGRRWPRSSARRGGTSR
jgi:2-dehydro-3-deoxygluconokinase